MAVTTTDRWRGREIPVPYNKVWDLMRWEHPQRWAGGVPVRIQSIGEAAPAPAEDWSMISSVTTVYQRFVLQPQEVFERVCGIVDPPALHRVMADFNTYSRGRYYSDRLSLCREHHEALNILTNADGAHLRQYQHFGIPVHDPYYVSADANAIGFPDRGYVRISPAEVFAAMQVCGVEVPQHLLEYMHENRRLEASERYNEWDRRVSVSYQPRITLEAMQRSRVELEHIYQPMPSMMVTGATFAREGWLDAPRYEFTYDMGEFPRPSSARTPEQQARWEQAQLDAVEAGTRALALLERVVQPAEFQSYTDNKYIELIGKKYRYRIKKVGQTSIYGLKSGAMEMSACLQLTGASAPAEDRVVMEYLMIRNKESKYLKEANLFPTSGNGGVGMNNILQNAINALGGSLVSLADQFAAPGRESINQSVRQQAAAETARLRQAQIDATRPIHPNEYEPYQY